MKLTYTKGGLRVVLISQLSFCKIMIVAQVDRVVNMSDDLWYVLCMFQERGSAPYSQ